MNHYCFFLSSCLHSASYCYFYKVPCVVSLEKEHCYSIFSLKETPEVSEVSFSPQSQRWPGCLWKCMRSCREPHQPHPQDSPVRSKCCSDRMNVHRKSSGDINNTDPIPIVNLSILSKQLIFSIPSPYHGS